MNPGESPAGAAKANGTPRRSRGRSAALPVQSTQIPQVMAALKELFRRQGLQHRDVAAALGVTERTLARWMAASSVTMQAIEDLCRVADITLLQLFDFMNREIEPTPAYLTLHQEQEIAEDPICWVLYANLLHGISVAEVRQQFQLPEPEIVLALVKLERLGLIRLFAGNRTTLTGPRNVSWRKDGPIARKRAELFRRLLHGLDFGEAKLVSESNVLRLSRRSLFYMQDKFRLLMREVLDLAQEDRQTAADSATDWYVLMIGAHRIDASPYEFWRLISGADSAAAGLPKAAC